MKKWILSLITTLAVVMVQLGHAGQAVPISETTTYLGSDESALTFKVNGEVKTFPILREAKAAREEKPSIDYNQVTLAGCVTTNQTIYSTSNLPYGSSVVAFGPYNVNCSGYQTFNVSKLNSGAYTNVTLQRYNGSTWVDVASSISYISVSVAAGTYRFIISNTCCGSPLQWKLDVSRTL